jgi:hypothetical protein
VSTSSLVDEEVGDAVGFDGARLRSARLGETTRMDVRCKLDHNLSVPFDAFLVIVINCRTPLR